MTPKPPPRNLPSRPRWKETSPGCYVLGGLCRDPQQRSGAYVQHWHSEGDLHAWTARASYGRPEDGRQAVSQRRFVGGAESLATAEEWAERELQRVEAFARAGDGEGREALK